jgi:predicted transcriptional regulator
MNDQFELTEITAGLVAAYVSGNAVAAADVPGLIRRIHAALAEVADEAEAPSAVDKEPAVPVRRSITPDYLICLEDGRKFKSLKRHLRTRYDLSPEQYRAKWSLAQDYPMVAPNYAQARSDLAKRMGLGQGGRKPARKSR